MIKELNQVLKKLKLGKAPGHDEITNEMIKFINEKGRLELLGLFKKNQRREKAPNEQA